MNCVRTILAMAAAGAMTARAEAPASTAPADPRDAIAIEVSGRPFVTYHPHDARFPIFFPVVESHGIPMTRQWPLREDAVGEDRDHPHHRSLWFTHGSVNGLDFWSNKEGATIVPEAVYEQRRDGDAFILRTRSRWVKKTGELVCADRRTYRAHPGPAGAILDAAITIEATSGEVFFGDTKEGSFAIRVPAGLSINGSKGASHIVTSEGLRDKEAWGKPAAWCDYSGTLSNRTLGVAIFDHPANPRPARWHVREYGLFAANPFGGRGFDPKQPEAGLRIAAGASATFRYRVYFHDGDTAGARLDECLREFAATAAGDGKKGAR